MEKFNNEKKKRQLENLTNLVEKHTRTQRHLEQYSEIGNKEYKEFAQEKQEIRQNEIDNLKDKIIYGDNQTQEEIKKDTIHKYKGTGKYVENNFDNISKKDLKNIQEKQKNRKIQLENFDKE